MFCLTEKPDNILMWTHYANIHSGFCIEYETGDNSLLFGMAQEVNYETEYPVFDMYNTNLDEQIDKIFLTKHKSWSYEKEHRVFDLESGPGLRHYESELMTGRIFGINMSEEHKSLIYKWLDQRGSPIEIKQARQSQCTYLIELDEVWRLND